MPLISRRAGNKKKHVSRPNGYTAKKALDFSRLFLAFAGFWVRLGLGLAFVGCVSVALLFVYRYVTVQPFFAVKHVVVRGNSYRDTEQIIAESGIRMGKNIFETRLKDIQQELVHDPWIIDVSVRRVLPDRVEIDILEKQAFFWVTQGKNIYYADRKGECIARVGPEKFISLPVLSLVRSEPRQVSMLDKVVRLVEDRRLPFGFSSVAGLALGEGDLLEIMLESPPMKILIGTENLSVNCGRLGLVWNDLRRLHELNAIRSFHVFQGKVWAQRG